MSPTYVPDLVHASLDLLFDRESGIWHLTNDGSVTWFDFARTAARLSGRDENLIVPVGVDDVRGRARRPTYTALASSRGQLLRPLDEALNAYLDDDRAARAATGTDGCATR
jgi:dTDP-4-dehydrorhamnose reductase